MQNCAILCLNRIKKETEAMGVTLTGNLQSVLWAHIRDLDINPSTNNLFSLHNKAFADGLINDEEHQAVPYY